MTKEFEYIVISPAGPAGWKYKIKVPPVLLNKLDIQDETTLAATVARCHDSLRETGLCKVSLIEMWSNIPGGYIGNKRLKEPPEWFPASLLTNKETKT